MTTISFGNQALTEIHTLNHHLLNLLPFIQPVQWIPIQQNHIRRLPYANTSKPPLFSDPSLVLGMTFSKSHFIQQLHVSWIVVVRKETSLYFHVNHDAVFLFSELIKNSIR